ncbi:MAG: aminomethyl-transferring glycine dehydrogenase subunit GcvPB [Acidobacteria bacterium]|nr:aminomethyl-transferring glycine dehydrogenase subunit GcvPB [Acidobacteriota bacterium]
MKPFREFLIFERSRPGKIGCPLPELDVPEIDLTESLPEMVRDELDVFPEVSEVEVVRHFTRLSQWNFGIDQGMYPLGSCTMKHNPRINEAMAALPGLAGAHPLARPRHIQGCLALIHELQTYLSDITGLPHCSTQPAAGAHGEFTGILLIKALLDHKGEKRTTVIVPDSAHGTNPATASLCGFDVKEVPSDERGCVDVAKLAQMIDDQTAGMMITNPNTLGIFETHIREIADMLHAKGAYLYMDGANMNALVGKTKPGDMGVDVLHLNLHKTFSTPHGGGGPGAGPICCTAELAPFLPKPWVTQLEDGSYTWQHDCPDSMGKVHGWYGQFGVLVRALTWILTLGREGLVRHTEHAVLNNNYLRKMLEPHYEIPFKAPTLHETVFNDKRQQIHGVSTMDIAKSLLDYGFHPPTVYFPLVVHGALMVEPTETESRGELNRFARALIDIAERSASDPESVRNGPLTTQIQRADETTAARYPVLRWLPEQKES